MVSYALLLYLSLQQSPDSAEEAFFNSESGYRGKYFQGTKEGNDANRELIATLKKKLVDYAKRHSSSIKTSIHQSVENSLNKNSAKIWIHQASSTLNEKQYKTITDVAIENPCWCKFALRVEEDNRKPKSERNKN